MNMVVGHKDKNNIFNHFCQSMSKMKFTVYDFMCYTNYKELMMVEENTNRKVKDSVFVDLFGKDETAPQNFLDLYNALHGTSLSLKDTTLEQEVLDSVMYMTYANDVAMKINNKIVVLIEHQSTINENMPLRLLDYITRIYDRIIPSKAKFKRALIKIPMPEFYVLYNGVEKTKFYFEKRLSEAFERENDDMTPVPLELVVKVYNINTGIGDELLDKCNVLKQYSQLIDLVRYSKEHAEEKGIEQPFSWAIREAKKREILPEYLERKASEVINMFNMEYDYDVDIAVQKEEARQQAYFQTARTMLQDGFTIEQVSKYSHLPIADVAKLKSSVAYL